MRREHETTVQLKTLDNEYADVGWPNWHSRAMYINTPS